MENKEEIMKEILEGKQKIIDFFKNEANLDIANFTADREEEITTLMRKHFELFHKLYGGGDSDDDSSDNSDDDSDDDKVDYYDMFLFMFYLYVKAKKEDNGHTHSIHGMGQMLCMEKIFQYCENFGEFPEEYCDYILSDMDGKPRKEFNKDCIIYHELKDKYNDDFIDKWVNDEIEGEEMHEFMKSIGSASMDHKYGAGYFDKIQNNDEEEEDLEEVYKYSQSKIAEFVKESCCQISINLIKFVIIMEKQRCYNDETDKLIKTYLTKAEED